MNQHKHACLKAENGQMVKLLGVNLSGDLRGLMFEASIEQHFFNPTDKNIEVVYHFPLPWGAVLLGVDVVLGNKHLTGAVVERKQAEAVYEEAISEGNAAIMLEKNHDQSYSLNLGNLAAREYCNITLRYAQTLQFEQWGLRLLIPTVIAPRYGDAQQEGGMLLHQIPSHSLTVDYPFELELRIHGALAQARVASASHLIGVAYVNSDQGNVLKVSLLHRESLDRDFVLVVDQLVHDSVTVAAHDSVEPNGVAMLLSVCPRMCTQDITSISVKILVDCSGSMAGDSIDAAKRALQAIIQQFDTDDRFSLSRFGSIVEHRSRGLWKVREASKSSAQQWVSALEADLGGTEMESALSSTFALAQTVKSDVLLITDGEISAIDSTIKSAKASRHRLFIIGIGSSPAETHLRRLAEATGGACDFVAPGEAVEPAILRMFARLRSPRLTDLSLEWPTGVVPTWVSPLLHAVFDGDTLNIFAFLKHPPSGEVRLLGRYADSEVLQELGVVTLPSQLETAATLSRMAASVRIQSVDHKVLIDKVANTTELAIAYQLVTDKTNFLLVHERPDGERASNMPALQKVEQMIPAGWSGLSRTRGIRGTNVCLDIPCIRQPGWDSPDYLIQNRMDNHIDSNYLTVHNDCFVIEQQPSLVLKHDSTLTSWEFSEWLRITSVAEWPTSYKELRQMNVDKSLVDWLELAMKIYEGGLYAESKVVETFLFLMSRQDTYEVLETSENLLDALKFTVQQLEVFANDPTAKPANIDITLAEAIMTALEDVTGGLVL